MEISVLDRQKAVLQRLYQNQAQVWPNQVDLIDQHYNMNYPLLFDHHQSNCNNNNNNNSSSMSRLEKSNHQERHCTSSNFIISSRENNNVSCSIKKRKAEYDVEDECVLPKELEKLEPEESQSAVTTKNEKASSINTDKSKVSDVQKPDYIHVRARRGQATDSHSLAERARREKISKKMKCLQDLVPGCNRATGKAGMLDEIINYVQSLQKQVEFLSMKLAVLNPRLDFSIDDFFAKEIPAYIASLPTAIQQEAIDSMCLQLNNANSNHGFDMAMNHHQSQPLPQKASNLTSSMQIPEAFLDQSFIQQLQQMTGWETDCSNLYNISGLQ